jgi:hypothetical protein
MVASAEVSTLQATGEAIKTTLSLVANACDGAIFPLKAVPQTVLLVIKHVEVRLSEHDLLNITRSDRSLREIRALAPHADAVVNEAVMMCGAVARHYRQKSFDTELRADVDRFLE